MEFETLLTTMHWGTYEVSAGNGRLVSVEPWSGDPDPSPIGRSMLGTVQGDLRVDAGAGYIATCPVADLQFDIGQMSRFEGAIPPVTAFDPPATVRLADVSGLAGALPHHKEA